MMSVSTGKIGKEERLEREIQESKLKLGRDDLRPPAFLDADFIKLNGVTATRENQFGEYETVSPWVSAQEKYAKQIMQCSAKLGLATTDRLKLIVPTKDEEQPINKYMKYAK